MEEKSRQAWSESARRVAPLVRKWSRIWMLPVSYGMAICEIESSFRPESYNGAAASQSGAWGLMQVTWTTALDLVAKLQKTSIAARDVISRSFRHDDTSCMLDPELNVMVGTFFLGRLATQFGQGKNIAEIRKVAAAYHSGAGFLLKFLKDGKSFPDELPPKCLAYVGKALDAQKKYLTEDGSDNEVTPPLEPIVPPVVS